MLSALRPVAVIPIEAANLKVYHSTILDKYIYIFQFSPIAQELSREIGVLLLRFWVNGNVAFQVAAK
jgi:hypothetical protein